MLLGYSPTICLQLLDGHNFAAVYGHFWLIFLFLGTPCQYGPMLKSDMTQGKSEIVSGTNFGSKNEKLEPFS